MAQSPPIPDNEQERLNALQAMGILDTPPEGRFDSLTKKAAERFGSMVSTVSLIDKDREWFKSCYGTYIGTQGPRDISFCGHAMLSKDIFIVEDTKKDPRFADNPYVTGPPFVRFYAGVALYDRTTNLPIGAFCIKGSYPREFNEKDISDLLQFAKLAENELNSKPPA